MESQRYLVAFSFFKLLQAAQSLRTPRDFEAAPSNRPVSREESKGLSRSEPNSGRAGAYFRRRGMFFPASRVITQLHDLPILVFFSPFFQIRSNRFSISMPSLESDNLNSVAKYGSFLLIAL